MALNGDARRGVFSELVESAYSPELLTSPKLKPAGKDIDSILKSTNQTGLKQFLRDGNWPVNHEIRACLWEKLAYTLHKNQGSIYGEIVKDIPGNKSALGPSDASLPGFVDTTNLHTYHLNVKGTASAKRIICVIGATKPDITFSPMLFPLICILLHYLGEEESYNCVQSLLSKGQNYIMQTRKAYEVSKLVLKDLARSHAKSPYQVLVKSQAGVERVMDNWLWWILNGLPFEYLVRILDCYLLEGFKVFHRVALAILISYHKFKVKASPKKTLPADVDIMDFCRNLPVSVDKLLKTAFGIRGLSRKEINKLTLKTQMYLESLDHVHSRTSRTSATSDIIRAASLDDVRSRPRATSTTITASDIPDSGILGLKEWQEIWQWIPRRYTICQPQLLFTTQEHGTSLKTFFQRCDGYEPTILVIKTTNKEIFGAFCSSDWEVRKNNKDLNLSYFGTGETFLFQLSPRRVKYDWVGIKKGGDTSHSEHLFMSGDTTKISIGGGGGEAIQLDENCYQGWSAHSDTFNNPPLVDGKFFTCSVLEVFSIQ